MATVSVDASPSYADLVAELRGAAEDFDTLRRILSQLGAIAYNARHPEVRRADEVLELSCYIADDWANSADLMRERIEKVICKIPA